MAGRPVIGRISLSCGWSGVDDGLWALSFLPSPPCLVTMSLFWQPSIRRRPFPTLATAHALAHQTPRNGLRFTFFTQAGYHCCRKRRKRGWEDLETVRCKQSIRESHFPNPRNLAAHRSDGPGDPKITQLAGGRDWVVGGKIRCLFRRRRVVSSHPSFYAAAPLCCAHVTAASVLGNSWVDVVVDIP